MKVRNWKTRESKKLPPEKLLDILRRIYPEEEAVKIFKTLIAYNEVKKGSKESG